MRWHELCSCEAAASACRGPAHPPAEAEDCACRRCAATPLRARARGQGGRRHRGAPAARLHGAHLRALRGQAGGGHGQLPAQVHAVPVRGRGRRARARRRVPPARGRLPQDGRIPARCRAAQRAAQPACRRCPGCAAEPVPSALRTSQMAPAGCVPGSVCCAGQWGGVSKCCRALSGRLASRGSCIPAYNSIPHPVSHAGMRI